MDRAKMNRDDGNQPQSFHSFLNALKGKDVKIYKGGPLSKVGKLLDVKKDFIVLGTQDNNVIYYQTSHVKSIIEDSKANSSKFFGREGEELDFVKAESFSLLLEELVDETIQINLSAPDSKSGLLVGVYEDYIVIFTEEDGILYLNTQHIKSVSRIQNGEEEEGNALLAAGVPKWHNPSNFHDVFSHFSHQWVSINGHGPEAVEGVLVENTGGHYTLVNNQEVMRILPFHVKSICSGPKGAFKQNKQNKEEESKQESSQHESAVNQSEESSSHESSSSNESSSHESSSYESSSRESSSYESSSHESSSSSHRTSGKRRNTSRKRTNRGRIVKTIDYFWKP